MIIGTTSGKNFCYNLVRYNSFFYTVICSVPVKFVIIRMKITKQLIDPLACIWNVNAEEID